MAAKVSEVAPQIILGWKPRKEEVGGTSYTQETFLVLSSFPSGTLSYAIVSREVSMPRLAPIPKLGRLVTHEGAAADRLALPAAEVCSLLLSCQ